MNFPAILLKIGCCEDVIKPPEMGMTAALLEQSFLFIQPLMVPSREYWAALSTRKATTSASVNAVILAFSLPPPTMSAVYFATCISSADTTPSKT
ncbi:hypothetical protein D3C80_1766680 [compost metagenome]